MPKIKHRVIIDTNLWISFLLMKDFVKIDSLFNSERLILLFSQELLDEFIEVAQRPKFKKYFSTTDLQSLVQKMRTIAEFISVTSNVKLCRDEKDNFLLALAKDGKATHLITGDKDLLVLDKVGSTEILSMREYLV